MNVPLPLAQIALSAWNHLLAQQPALADGLLRHAGRHLRLVVRPPWPAAAGAGPRRPGLHPARPTRSGLVADARIGATGRLVAVSEPVEPAVTLTVSPSLDALTGLFRQGPEGLTGHLHVEGDVMLATAIGNIARALRWDYEEDLSRVVGDVAAHRIGEGVRGAGRDLRAFGGRALDAVGRAATQGPAGGVPTGALVELADEIADLDVRVGRLERLTERQVFRS